MSYNPMSYFQYRRYSERREIEADRRAMWRRIHAEDRYIAGDGTIDAAPLPYHQRPLNNYYSGAFTVGSRGPDPSSADYDLDGRRPNPDGGIAVRPTAEMIAYRDTDRALAGLRSRQRSMVAADASRSNRAMEAMGIDTVAVDLSRMPGGHGLPRGTMLHIPRDPRDAEAVAATLPEDHGIRDQYLRNYQLLRQAHLTQGYAQVARQQPAPGM